MDNQNITPESIPELDPKTANQLLDNVFAACEVTPNAIPLEILESWGNYKKTDFRIGRIVSYAILVLLILLPLVFIKPTIIAQRTNVDAADNAVFRIEIKNLLPVEGTSATLDGRPVALEKVDSKTYMAEITQNGTLEVQTKSWNGQKTVKTYEVTHLDTEKPELVRSYSDQENIYLVVRDTYSGIDYNAIIGTDADKNQVRPVSFDKDEETVAFRLPSQPITVSIPDHSGNILQILISPAE